MLPVCFILHELKDADCGLACALDGVHVTWRCALLVFPNSSGGQGFLTDNTTIFDCWSEHLRNIFSASRTVQDTDTHHISQLLFRQELDKPPTFDEMIEAIVHLQHHRAVGVDCIPPEIWRYSNLMHHYLHNLLVCC